MNCVANLKVHLRDCTGNVNINLHFFIVFKFKCIVLQFHMLKKFAQFCIKKTVIKSIQAKFNDKEMGPVKRICVFKHSVMTNFNCACPDIQRG